MKITRVKTRVVDLPLSADFHPAWARGRKQTNILMVLIEVETDHGITGIGAAHAGIEAAVTIERFVAPHFIGQDPRRVEALAQILDDAEILGAPTYCMEIPLWDVLGKLAGLPVCTLWGGFSDRVTAYCATAEIRSPAQRVEDVHRMLDAGFRAVKLRFHHPDPRDDLKVVEAIRKAAGSRIDILVDANQAGVEPGFGGHGRWGYARALEVALALQDLGVVWLEEPLPRHDYTGLKRLRDQLGRLKLAGGEDNHGLHEFKLLIEQGCYDVLQPDALLSEGVSQMRKIAALAEAAHLEVAPHTWGNGIGLLANLHFACSIRNGSYFEFPHDPPSGFTLESRDQMLVRPLTIDRDGCVVMPEQPGFGFELNEDLIRSHTIASFG